MRTGNSALSSSGEPDVNAGPDEARVALWALFAGNFVIGTGILLPAGMLNDLSAGLSVTAETAGLLMLVGGIVIGFGAPIFATLTSTVDRRLLLASSLAPYPLRHAVSRLAPRLWV